MPWYVIGLLVILFLAFGGISLIRYLFPGAVSFLPGGASGFITSTGNGENWTMQPSSCQSGERRQFFGAMFFDNRQSRLGGRIASPEDSPTHIVLNTPTQGGAVELTRDQCTVWDVDLHHTSSTYNGIWAVSGHARFDCTFDQPQARFTGDIHLHSCH